MHRRSSPAHGWVRHRRLVAQIEPPKGDDNQLLDELLGIDPRAFEDDERTQVFRSDPPPPDQEEDAPTGIPAAVAPRPVPLPAFAPAPPFRAAPKVLPAAAEEALAEERVTIVTAEPEPVAQIATEQLPDESAHAEVNAKWQGLESVEVLALRT